MLKTITSEILPLSNTKVRAGQATLEYEEVKYLNFDEALDAIAGESEDIQEDDDKTSSFKNENDELFKSLQEDTEGLF
jgi:hypothetical protein